MKLLTRTEEIILITVLRLKDNAYGVTIRDEVSRLSGYEWTFGAVYVPLDKLTQKGFLKKKSGPPTKERGGRSKCFYELSREAKAALKHIREIHKTIWNAIPDPALD